MSQILPDVLSEVGNVADGEPVDFGQVESGAIREATLTLQNRGGPLPGLNLSAESVVAEGGLIEFVLPDRLPALPAKESTTVPIKIAVSPLVSSRGPIQGLIRLRRPSGVESTVAVRLAIVDPGKAPSQIVISPNEVQLTAKPGEVVKFNLSVKLGPETSSADQFDVEAKPLNMTNGTTGDREPEFRWASGNAVTPTGRAILQGFVVGPSKSGTYRSEITIKSGRSGVKVVPLTIVVP
ncbi:MAG: hypothetical protein NTY19_09125 [Planctomycetota bacterium]|nr:hypothetical protein [Planctomycetota bacterium]